MKLVINQEIEQYAKNSNIGVVWLETINDVLELWNEDPFVQPSAWKSLQRTLYLNDVQSRIRDSVYVQDWFKMYTHVINENMSLICVKVRKEKKDSYLDDLDYLQIFWDRLNSENEIHAKKSNVMMN